MAISSIKKIASAEYQYVAKCTKCLKLHHFRKSEFTSRFKLFVIQKQNSIMLSINSTGTQK